MDGKRVCDYHGLLKEFKLDIDDYGWEMKDIIHIVRSPHPVEIVAVSGKAESYYPIIDYYHRLDQIDEVYQEITIEALLEELTRMKGQI